MTQRTGRRRRLRCRAMDLEHIVKGVKDAASVKRVFGEPYQVDGVTIIPVARAGGGGGGGEGSDPEGGRGSGGGFGLGATPVGVYTVTDGRVEWVPVVDYAALATRVAVVAVAGALAWRSVAKARQRRKALAAKYG